MARRPVPLFKPEPGWLFLAAGAAILAACVLLPAQDDLAAAHHEREKAWAIERWQRDRVARHVAYLDALDAGDPLVLRSLAATELNRVPPDAEPILPYRPPAGAAAIDHLEPHFIEPVPLSPPDSRLHRLVTGPARLWVIAGGAVCVLLGLLPPGPAGTDRTGLRSLARRLWSLRPRFPGAIRA